MHCVGVYVICNLTIACGLALEDNDLFASDWLSFIPQHTFVWCRSPGPFSVVNLYRATSKSTQPLARGLY